MVTMSDMQKYLTYDNCNMTDMSEMSWAQLSIKSAPPTEL